MLLASILLATSFSDEFGSMIIVLIVVLAMAMHYGKKYGDANPDVKDAAKKATASTAIELIGRIFKKK
jgi:hypothetical protein